jgi:hypothetical protein
MTRTFTAETSLQGHTLLSFGARACQPSRSLDNEVRSGRREAAESGLPDQRW